MIQAVSPTFTGAADTFAISAGALPSGLSIDAANGIISGTPAPGAASGAATVTASLAGGGSDTFTLTYTVNAPSSRAVFSVSETLGILSTHYVEPTSGYLRTADYITGLDSPRDLAQTPDLDFLFVANSGGTINAYAVDHTTAALTEVLGSPFAMSGGASHNPQAIIVSPDAEFIYTANKDSDNISGFAIAADGSLTELAGSPFGATDGARDLSVLSLASGDYLYVTALNEATDRLQAFHIGASGDLVKIDGDPTGTNPTSLVVAPEGDFLWIGNQGVGTVGAFSIAVDGTVTEIGASPFALDGSAAGGFLMDVAITNDGASRSLFASVSNGSISQYVIAGDGSLSLHVTPAVSFGGAQLRGIAVSPAGEFLYALDDLRDEFDCYTVGALGLSEHPTLPRIHTQGKGIAAVVMASVELPVWRTDAIYSTNFSGGEVTQFSVDAAGQMTPIIPSAVNTAPLAEDLVINGAGNMMYVSHPADLTSPLMAIPVNTDGSLDDLNAVSTVVPGNDSTYLSLSPNSRHLYVLDVTASVITPYALGVDGVVGSAGTTAAAAVTFVQTDLTMGSAGLSAFAINNSSLPISPPTVSQFTVNPTTGAITAMGVPTVATVTDAPRAGLMHPSGRHFYVSTAGAPGPDIGDSIRQFRVDPSTRALSPLVVASISVGSDPRALAISPNGKFLVVTNDVLSTIEVYEINTTKGNGPEDGELLATPKDGAVVSNNPRSLAFSMDGSVIFVGTDSSATIEAFTISATGILAPLDSESTGGVVHSITLRNSVQ
jgi:6-phosphogluconolactonase (cycloisomerase 2 family)